jgi:ABC-type multidrug transport system fused ATPase/permease subunit
MIKKANFFGVVKRFMEPALHDKKSLFLFSCVFLLWKIYEIANVYAFSQIVSVIQWWDKWRFEQILIQFLIFVVLYQVFSLFESHMFMETEISIFEMCRIHTKKRRYLIISHSFYKVVRKQHLSDRHDLEKQLSSNL